MRAGLGSPPTRQGTASRVAACNAAHGLEARFCRWLLVARQVVGDPSNRVDECIESNNLTQVVRVACSTGPQ